MNNTISAIQTKHETELLEVLKQVRPLTMVPEASLMFTWAAAIDLIERDIEGDFAEFGVWKGGCAFGLGLIQRAIFGKVVRPVWMFDSFEGLPPVDERDGPAAAQYQRDVKSPAYYDNCKADFGEAVLNRSSFGFSDAEAILIQGWFEDTLPRHMTTVQQRRLALLRVDCDWYAPVKFVLEQVDPAVTQGGLVILDDYYSWDGCSRATHDFLSQRDHAYRLREVGDGLASYYFKNDGVSWN